MGKSHGKIWRMPIFCTFWTLSNHFKAKFDFSNDFISNQGTVNSPQSKFSIKMLVVFHLSVKRVRRGQFWFDSQSLTLFKTSYGAAQASGSTWNTWNDGLTTVNLSIIRFPHKKTWSWEITSVDTFGNFWRVRSWFLRTLNSPESWKGSMMSGFQFNRIHCSISKKNEVTSCFLPKVFCFCYCFEPAGFSTPSVKSKNINAIDF